MNGSIAERLHIRSDATPDVLFLIGCWPGESKRYRVFNLAEGLIERGYDCIVHDFFALKDILALRVIPRVLVFFRAPYEAKSGVVELLDYCRRHRITTVFDIDDYVFEPAIIDHIDAIRHFSDDDAFDYNWGVKAYRSLMFACDRVTASTPYLASRAQELGREAHCVVNSFNAEQLALATGLANESVVDNDEVRIGYYSGSATHNADFAVCAPALQEIMDRYANVRFRLVGLLDLDVSWARFADRIDRSGFLEPLTMLRDLHRCDICIAPLVESNPFCDGKSELKFFEAALVGVPTIASRTHTFAAAIMDGDTGFLASTRDEWVGKLASLIKDRDLRRQMAERARHFVLTRYSVGMAARQALAAYGLEAFDHGAPRVISRRLTIGWILPGLIIGGGGHRNILRAAFHLERFGYDVRLYIIDTDLESAVLHRMVRRHFYPFQGKVERFDGAVAGEDVLFATHWSTVAAAQMAAGSRSQIIYFVQDFEPAFYPMGSEYLAAENTYRQNLYAICSGPWCSALLRSRYGMESDSFQFPVDTSTYHLTSDAKRKNRLVFFAKPEMPRRCFALGVAALRLVKAMRPDLEIVFFGSGSEEAVAVDFEVRQAGVLPTIGDLADLYRTSLVGVVFSTTNPSLVPYEMMACGLPVVDLDIAGADINYGGRRDIVLLADAMPQRMAEQIVALVDDEGDRAARSRRGRKLVAGMPNEQGMARRIEQLMIARCHSMGIDVDDPVEEIPAIGAVERMLANE